jgi:gamma-glutamyltranspeptidase/glutathione hydrolase
VVATSQPLAAQAGLGILQNGGNAVDAAVATAAALNVVEPMSTGIGGDMFALIWTERDKKVTALNGSGRSPMAANPEDLLAKGYDCIPTNGPDVAFAVSIPGAVDGWQKCLDIYGTMTLREVLQPAIEYADAGYPVSELIARAWAANESNLKRRPSGTEMLIGGRAPGHGEMMHLPTLCKSLQVIAEGGAEAFYKGDLATKIANFVQAEGGWVTANDFAIHKSDWDEPIKTQYRGTTVWECPPNGHGIAALISLNIAEGFDIANMGSQSADWYHYLIESMRLGYADSLQYVADPRVCEVPIRGLLSKEYSTERRGKIKQKRSMTGVHYGQPVGHGDTVYLSVVDGQGNACSFINSLYQGFGTGLVVPGTGIALQNRGALFSLDPHHPNYLEGGKRPYQTIIPAIATREDELWLCFGVMGGFQQPQGHLQVISNMVDFGMDSQRALDALRFSIDVQNTGNVRVEEGIDPKTVVELRRRGHDLSIIKGYERGIFGGGQVISRDPLTGVLIGGSEPRKDGGAVGW